jgi:hypothetical protein
MVQEARTLAEIQKDAAKKFAAATSAERVRLRHDMEEVDRELRKLMVYQKATDHLLVDRAERPQELQEKTIEVPPIADSWVDRFNQFARSSNEPWRAELLAQAMATEADRPGTVSTRALWFIGTVDEKIFHAFSSLLNICTLLDRRHVVPGAFGTLATRELPNVQFGDGFQIGGATFMLTDLGLIGDPVTSGVPFKSGTSVEASYGELRYQIDTTSPHRLQGIVMTDLGSIIANFCAITPNADGESYLKAWVETIPVGFAKVTRLN